MIHQARVLALIVAASCVNVSVASAAPTIPPSQVLLRSLGITGRALHPPRPFRRRLQITDADRLRAAAAGWQRVTATPPFASAGEAMLMTDGTVFLYDNNGNWFTLTPDNFGNYVNGTWSQDASLPAGYTPYAFASAVLPSGDVIVEGGEYNGGGVQVETNLGAYYDRSANTWSAVAPPKGWKTIGDAPSVVLANGTFMLGNCCSIVRSQDALFNSTTKAWTETGGANAPYNAEQGWTLLPNGNVLTVDVLQSPGSALYNPASGRWSSAGKLPKSLTGSGEEMGPQVLRPDGTVFVGGADEHTAIYNTHTGLWSAGPNFPIIGGAQVDMADAPASLLTNGNVLMAVSPGLYNNPSYFLIFDGTKFTQVAGPPGTSGSTSSDYNMLLLPTGQVLETDYSFDVEIYTPRSKPYPGIAPVIPSVPQQLTHGETYEASGVLFNGVSQANAFGDDAQAATNFPLIAITNASTGHVFFARTHDFSSMAVASPALVTTMFDVPSTIETGPSNLVVVANGIQSQPVAVTIQ